MAKLVSSRRGSNFLLHNLEESDVVFGTKGNGRNEVFLKVLESHSGLYIQLSKFQKMGLIQQIIRDWKGNFYILNSKTNDLHLAKKRDHDLSTTDPSSKKLYTSVRRMMNYVNSKVHRKPHQSAITVVGTKSPSGTTAMRPLIPAIAITSLAPQAKKEHTKMKGKKKPTAHITNAAIEAGPDKPPPAKTSMDYICKNHVTLPLPDNALSSLPFTPNNINISKPKRSTIVVSPEPSPRSAFLRPSPISSLPLSKPDISTSETALNVSPLSISQFSSETIAVHLNDNSGLFSKQQAPTTMPLIARNKEIKEDIHTAVNGVSGDLEQSAILALRSLGSSSPSRTTF
eukprot:CAMPEP_0168193632 /NCGR_PEP_ID=MMETSP0139_2-20121125/18714_1 /TAXON_ID=44445 /ORGANISM="Pseudo-nitzschia australis, Strain 10249 10 AB" /LENGTH=342 /DNA_ID=CAMNT_0008117009 /DNA_START=46 /DNA_END=1074 /DNA_ORIENTATION=-